MIPPVSLPLKLGTQSALAGAQSSIVDSITRLAATIFRIGRTPFPNQVILGGIRAQEKRAQGLLRRLADECCRAALDRGPPSRHGRPQLPAGPFPRGLLMRDLAQSLATSLKRLGLACGTLLALLAFGQQAQAANPLEQNFWLSG